MPENFNKNLATRLKSLRLERDWSLDDLATRSAISRATLSRVENASTSPTTELLSKLCATYGLTMSRLLSMVEETFTPLLSRDDQPVWHDQKAGFTRRSVSPPAHPLAGEVLECTLEPGAELTYDTPAKSGLEHHLIMLTGKLSISIEDQTHALKKGDCLRYQLVGETVFRNTAKSRATYFLFII